MGAVKRWKNRRPVRAGDRVRVVYGATGYPYGAEGRVVAIITDPGSKAVQVRFAHGWTGYFERHQLERI